MQLYNFQKEGVTWLQAHNGIGLLADDMGLGKSAQSLMYLKQNPTLRPALIVCPAVLKLNWQREISMWTGEDSYIISGQKSTPLATYPFYIINYDIFASELKIDTGKKTAQGKKILKKVLKDSSWIFKLASMNIQCIIADECFVYDTLIATNKGLLKIGDIVENKMQVNVFCINSLGILDTMPIKHYIKNIRTDRLLRIKHQYGEIICTENHLFWSATDAKWKKISTIQSGENLCILQEEIFNGKKRKSNSDILQSSLPHDISNVYSRKSRKIMWRKGKKNQTYLPLLQKIIFNSAWIKKQKDILFTILCGEKYVENPEYTGVNSHSRIIRKEFKTFETLFSIKGWRKSKKKIINENERKQSIQESKNHTKNASNTQKNRINRYIKILSRWKWLFDYPTNEIKKIIAKRLGIRISNPNKNENIQRKEPSNFLQSRYRKQRKENSNRSGWSWASFRKNKSKGLFENKRIRITRVESIAFLELGYNGKSEKDSQYNFVYDLEIDIHHNYFAEGILVHNCQALQNHKAIRTKAFYTLRKMNMKTKFIGLSGTPIKNKPAEFFTILNMLDERHFPNRWRFLNRYCNPKHNGFGWTFDGATNIEELHTKIQPIMLRRMKIDVLKDLPPKRKIVVPMETDAVEMKNYEQASYEFFKWVKSHTDAGLEAQKNIDRLKQLAYLAKRNAVIAWIEQYLESGNKLVVGTYHKHAMEDLVLHFKKISTHIDGSITGAKRQEAVDRFQTDKNTQLIICQILTVPGLTLTAASATCTVEFAWSPSAHIQFEDRVNRIGQEADSITAYYLIAPQTVEEKIMSMINTKFDIVNKIMDGKENTDIFENSMLKDLLTIYGKKIKK